MNESVIRVLEGQLDRLDPSNAPHRRVLGVELPNPREFTGEAYVDELDARRLAWLEERFREVSGREERRLQARRIRAAGVSRFLPEGTTLSDLTATTLTTPGALKELRDARFEECTAARELALEEATR